MLDGNTAITNKLFFGERTMRMDVHIRYQIRERVVPAILMRAKDNFTFIRVAVAILHLTQCAIAQHSTNDQAKLAIVIVGSFEFLFGDIFHPLRWKALTWPKSFICQNQNLITLSQLSDGHPLILFAAHDLKLVIGGTFQIAT